LNLIEANTNQKIDLENIQSADILIFVSPTYHHGIPAALKNFLEIVKEKTVYENKIIGLISSNSSGRAYGAYQAMEVLHGIIAYNKLNSYIISNVPIIDHENIDTERLREFIKYCSNFLNLTKNNIKL
jgi:NAD(P)H-dependent FMN reductase